MGKIGKRLTAARDGIDRAADYSVDDALKLLTERSKTKFDETIEISMNLGVDPRHGVAAEWYRQDRPGCRVCP